MTKWWMSRWLMFPLVAWFGFGSWMATLQVRAGNAEPWEAAVLIGGGAAAMALSLLIVFKRPEVKIGQLFALATAGFAASPFLLPDIEELMPDWAATLDRSLGSVLSLWALASVTWVIILFPDGRHPSRLARWLSVGMGVFFIASTPYHWRFFNDPGFVERNPGFEDGFFVAVLALFIPGIGVLIGRFRNATVEQRAQLKWLLSAVAVYALFLVVAEFYVGWDESIQSAVADTVVYTGIPVAMAVAILKYRVYEIDRIISRTVSYGVVIGMMAAVYAAVITAIHAVLPIEEDLAVAVSTLAGVAVASPLARRVREWVDRRFFRSRYVAAEVIGGFADELRATLDPALAASRAEAILADTFQVESVGVWVSEGGE